MKQLQENKKLLYHYLDIIIYLVKTNQALRCHRENAAARNKGNFLECVYLLSKYDSTLQRHITLAKKKECYFSKNIQNQFFKCLANHTVQEIVDEIKTSGVHSILADETCNRSKTEQMKLMLGYCLNGKLLERFICFKDLPKTDAETIKEAITGTLASIGLNIENARRQGYDGAANMSGAYNGVKTKILEINPLALHVHCHSHCLSLVLVDACRSLFEAKLFFGNVQMLYIFFENGSRRHSTLIAVQKENGIKAPISLQHISDTRWSSHITLLIAIKKCLAFLTNALQKVICYTSDGEIVAKADGLMDKLKSFIFVLALVMFTDIL